MIKNKNGKILAVVFTTVCMFVAMLGGFVGLFNTIDTSAPIIAHAATTVESYYQPLADDLSKTGLAFRSEVASLITSTHKTQTTYDGLRNIFDESDADPNKPGNIIWFYTGTSVAFNGSFNTGTNREHVWPKNAGNAFPAESECGSDAHHLRPANDRLNSTRSNNSFGEVPKTNGNIVAEAGSTSYGNSSDPDSYCYQANSTFFPSADYRGDTARILMYVQTRWGDKFNLQFVLGNGNNKTIGDIEDLFKWHLLDEPSEEEMRRNEVIFGIQGNRNPFIDHPEYAEMIYCYDGNSYNDELQAVLQEYGGYLDRQSDPNVEVTSVTINPASANLVVGETTSLSAKVTPDNAVKTVTWTSSNPSVASVNSTTGVVTALSAGTTTITATSTKTPSVKATATISVKALSAINVTGAPTKTTYESGEKFNPAGITVTATYSDMSTSVIPNSQIQWLDGKTGQVTLAAGTTSVTLKYGNITKTINGITVNQSKNTVFTFGENGPESHVDGNSATTKSYTQGSHTLNITNGTSLYVDAFDLKGNSALKLGTSSKTGSFSFTVPSDVISVVIHVAQYKANPTTITINGKSYSISTSSNEGKYTAITVDTSSTKTINFATASDGKRCMIDKIEFITGSSSGGTTCQHTPGNWIIDSNATCNVAGSKHTECTKCGEVISAEEIPTNNNHNWGAWTDLGNGTETRECSVCHKTETRACSNVQNVAAFAELVAAVENANTVETKWTAIKNALTNYNTLSSSEKDEASEAYALLATEIAEYNAEIRGINQQSTQATSDAINLFAGTLSVLAFAAYLLLKA